MNLAGNLASQFFDAKDLIGLRSFRSLNNVELDLIAFLQAFVAFALNRGVVNEHVGSAIPAQEAVPFCVVEPFHGALVLCQDPYSLAFDSSAVAERGI